MNVSLQTALTVGDGTSSGKSVLSVVEARVLKILKHQSIGLAIKAQAMPGSGFVNGGTVFFRKPNILQVTDYDSTGAAKQTPAESRVGIKLDTLKEIHYEIETLDIKRYFETMTGEQIANLIVSGWAEGATIAIAAFLDLQFINQAITSATAQKTVYTMKTITSDITSASTRDIAFSDGVGTVTTAYNALLKTINPTAVGVNRDEVYGLIDIPFKNVLIAGTGVAGADRALTNVTENTLGTNESGDGMTRLGGINWYSSALLNQPATAFTVFAKGSTIDTSNVAAVIVHREAIGMPMTPIVSEVILNPNNGNPVFVHKFVFGIDAVRPELTAVVKYFVKTPSSH